MYGHILYQECLLVLVLHQLLLLWPLVPLPVCHVAAYLDQHSILRSVDAQLGHLCVKCIDFALRSNCFC